MSVTSHASLNRPFSITWKLVERVVSRKGDCTAAPLCLHLGGNMNTIYSRRKALQAGTGLLLTLGTGALPLKLLADEPYADPEAADRWLLPLLHAPGAVAGALHMGRFRDRIYWVDKEIRWSPGPGQEGPSVVVPAGFVTDLASIPRVFWSLLPTDGVYTFPAIVNDYLYWTQTQTRETADDVFLYGMNDMGVSKVVAQAIYLAVQAEERALG